MTGEIVTMEVEGGVAVISLNRPGKLNAINLEMHGALRSCLAAADRDPEVRAVVLTGTGRGFCVGQDLTEFAGIDRDGFRVDEHVRATYNRLVLQMTGMDLPIIAAVNGVAAGGGFVLAAKCDLRFASVDASFVTIFSKRGLIAEHGLTWLLPRQIGTGDALDLLWSSRRIDAAEAHRVGLVQAVVPADELVDHAIAYVHDLAEHVSPTSLAVTKRLVYGQLGADMAEAFTQADDATWEGVEHPDATEGARAYIERRPPRFERVGDTT